MRHLFADFELAKTALAHWLHDAATLDADLALYRISANAVYPFRHNGQWRFLRLAPEEEKLEKNVRGEMEFIRYLLRNGYPALKPIRADNGETLLVLDTYRGRYYAAAFRRVDGVRVDQTKMNEPIPERCGQTLGRLHTLSARYVPKMRKWDHAEALEWIGRTLAENHAPDAAFRELAMVGRELVKLPINDGRYGLIHYDFEPDNLFYDAATGKCSVIDFDDGLYHWFALDVAQALDALGDCLEGERLRHAKTAFLKGYRRERGLTENDEALFPLMRRFIGLMQYARLARCVADEVADAPDWMVSLRAHLAGIITRLETRMTENAAPTSPEKEITGNAKN